MIHLPALELTTPPGRAYQVDVRNAKAVDEAIVSQVKEFNNRLVSLIGLPASVTTDQRRIFSSQMRVFLGLKAP